MKVDGLLENQLLGKSTLKTNERNGRIKGSKPEVNLKRKYTYRIGTSRNSIFMNVHFHPYGTDRDKIT